MAFFKDNLVTRDDVVRFCAGFHEAAAVAQLPLCPYLQT
jgi:hypothetical protein